MQPTPAEAGSPEQSVYNRYAAAAHAREEALCCPIEYAADYLTVIPQEIIERDYGCGNPTPYAHPGDTVLDLGSGGGKLCYILAQIVGEHGHVIGVDCNQEMLGLARKYQQQVAQRLALRPRRPSNSSSSASAASMSCVFLQPRDSSPAMASRCMSRTS